MEKKTFFNGRWVVEEEIGSGTTGTVYKVINSKGGVKSYSAIKEILLPKTKKEILNMYSQGATDSDVSEYFENKAQEWIAKEVNFLEQFKGNPNIVAIEDHDVLDREDMIGKIVVIRMELLETLEDYILTHTVTDKDILKMGLDILNALEDCEEKNVLHRDIKPQNVFVNRNKIFKLGDFSESKEIEKTVSNMTQRGTPNYMAPELYNGERGSKSLDTYSLGIMLYQYFNNNKLPFMPEKYKFEDSEKVLNRRMNGEELPPPINADEEISNIILKACSYKPEDRYQSAMDFRDELEKVYKKIKTPKILIKGKSLEKEEDVKESKEKNSESDTMGTFSDKKPLVTKSKNNKEQFGETMTPVVTQQEEEKEKQSGNDTIGTFSDKKPFVTKSKNNKEQFGETMTPVAAHQEKKEKQSGNDTIGIYSDKTPLVTKSKNNKEQFGETIEVEKEEVPKKKNISKKGWLDLEDTVIGKTDFYVNHLLGQLEYSIVKNYTHEDGYYQYLDGLKVSFVIKFDQTEEEYRNIIHKEEDNSYEIQSEKDLVINSVIWRELILRNEELKMNKNVYYKEDDDLLYVVTIIMIDGYEEFNTSFNSFILNRLFLHQKIEDKIEDNMEKLRMLTRSQQDNVKKLTNPIELEKINKRKKADRLHVEHEKIMLEKCPSLGNFAIKFEKFIFNILKFQLICIPLGIVLAIMGLGVFGAYVSIFGTMVVISFLPLAFISGIPRSIAYKKAGIKK